MKRRTAILGISFIAASTLMFRSLFTRNRAKGEPSFRERVHAIVSKLYPDEEFLLPEGDPDVIEVRKTHVGLQNLEAKFLQSDQKESTLQTLVEEHFAFVLSTEEPAVPPLAEALPRLRPQVMPPEYAQQAPIVSFPFGDSLAVGIVIDSEKGYLYLKREDADRWGRTPDSLLEAAIENLNQASREIAMQSTENEEVKFIGIETKDGFDAARILIPKLRGFIADRIGSPFFFGVPNRDFLICWNMDASAKFLQFTKNKLKKDFENQPYPLSPSLFEIDADGNITEHENKA